MKRWMQKLVSVLMCMTLVLSLGVTAFADGDEMKSTEPEPTQEQQDEEEALKKKQEEELKRQQEEELKRQQEEELRRQQEEAAAKEAAAKETPKEDPPAKEAVPAKEPDPEKEAAPAKETTPVKEAAPENNNSKQTTEEIVISDDIVAQPEDQPLNENNEEPIIVNEIKKQDENPEKAENTQKKADAPQDEKNVKEEKPADPESVVKQPEPVEETKPDEALQTDGKKTTVGENKKQAEPTSVEETVVNLQSVDDEEFVAETTVVAGKTDVLPQYAPNDIFKSSLSDFKMQLGSASLVKGGLGDGNQTDETNEVEEADNDSDSGTPVPVLKSARAPTKLGDSGADDGETINPDGSAKGGTDSGSVPAVSTDTAATTDTVASTNAAANTNTSAKDAKTVIEVDGTKYSDQDVAYDPEMTEDKDANPKLEGIGWVAEDGTLQLTNEEIKELIVKEGDLTIQAAGFNHINNLVTNSVVSIIGTGILLLDDVDLKDDGEVKLTENKMYADTGVTGSVAVFLKDKNADKANTYRLINAGIPGILDEAYTIPKGYNLIIPSGESLIMNSTVASGNPTDGYKYYSGDDAPASLNPSNVLENSALLKISDGASLTVEQGASIRMISTESVQAKGEAVHILTPMLEVENGGSLVQKGKLTGTGGLVVSDEKDYAVAVEVGVEKEPAITVKDTDALYDELKKDHNVGDTIGFDDLKAAWESMHPGETTDENAVFIFKYKGEDGNWHTAYISKKSGETVKLPDSASDWSKGMFINPYTGAGLISHQLGATGSGIIADMGSNTKLTFPAGSSKTILPIAAETNLWRVIVTENPKRDTWTLSVWYGDTQIFDLGVMTVRARFKFDLPDDWDGKNIYAVFLDKNGDLRAFPAKYYAATGELVFDSNLVGEFVIVNFDYKGELYSKDFYDELAKLDEVKHLVDLHTGKAK